MFSKERTAPSVARKESQAKAKGAPCQPIQHGTTEDQSNGTHTHHQNKTCCRFSCTALADGQLDGLYCTAGRARQMNRNPETLQEKAERRRQRQKENKARGTAGATSSTDPSSPPREAGSGASSGGATASGSQRPAEPADPPGGKSSGKGSKGSKGEKGGKSSKGKEKGGKSSRGHGKR